MSPKNFSRRDILKSLTIGVMAGSVLRVIPAQAAEHAHEMIAAETAAGGYTPKFFSAEQYKTLQTLSQLIIPPDGSNGGAIEAGAPEFIDLLTSENEEYQRQLGGGIMWLDSACVDRYGKAFVDCAAAQQTEILDLIAFRKNALTHPDISQGVEFFSFLRNLVSDGFFTSEIGIKYLGYIGNAHLKEFPGCPPIPGV